MNDLVQTNNNDLSLFSEQKFAHSMKVAEFISKSDMIPKGLKGKPSDVLICMEYGRRLGFGEMQALQNIAVVNGKPTLYGDGLLGACQGHHSFKSIHEEAIKDQKGELVGRRCTVIREGYDEPVVRDFTIEEAKKAGLWGRNTWASYPERMLQMRARGFALRDAFADVLNGFIIEEEARDYPTKDITPKKQKAEQLLSQVIDAKSDPVEETQESQETEQELMISTEQSKQIYELFRAKNLTKDRVNKAIQQFNASKLGDLTEKQALILIEQLSKVK